MRSRSLSASRTPAPLTDQIIGAPRLPYGCAERQVYRFRCMFGGMTDAQVAVGAMLARLRRRHGLSQARLAIRAGTSQAAISRIERGLESPTVDRLAALLQVMGQTLTLAVEPIPPWADVDTIGAEREMTPDERLEQGVRLAEFATELAASGARRDAHG